MRADHDAGAQPDRRTIMKGGVATLVALAAPAGLSAPMAASAADGAVFSAQPILFGVAVPAAASA
jgi:hypothetical protein